MGLPLPRSILQTTGACVNTPGVPASPRRTPRLTDAAEVLRRERQRDGLQNGGHDTTHQRGSRGTSPVVGHDTASRGRKRLIEAERGPGESPRVGSDPCPQGHGPARTACASRPLHGTIQWLLFTSTFNGVVIMIQLPWSISQILQTGSKLGRMDFLKKFRHAKKSLISKPTLREINRYHCSCESDISRVAVLGRG